MLGMSRHWGRTSLPTKSSIDKAAWLCHVAVTKAGSSLSEHLGLRCPSGMEPAAAAGTEAASPPRARTDCRGDDGASASGLAAAEIQTHTRTQRGA